MVALHHPKTGHDVDVPERQVAPLLARGWQRPDETPEPETPEPVTDEASSEPAEDVEPERERSRLRDLIERG